MQIIKLHTNAQIALVVSLVWLFGISIAEFSKRMNPLACSLYTLMNTVERNSVYFCYARRWLINQVSVEGGGRERAIVLREKEREMERVNYLSNV